MMRHGTACIDMIRRLPLDYYADAAADYRRDRDDHVAACLMPLPRFHATLPPV